MSSFASLLTRSCNPIINRGQRFTFSTINRDLIRHRKKEAAPVVAPVFNHDILLGTIKSAPSTENILKLVDSHMPVMNNKHLIQALRSIFTLQKSGNSALSTSQILKHPDFEKLCSNLKQKAGAIELNETIEALKVVCYVGVRSDSTISQVLLQMIRKQINSLTLQQIIFLDFLLQQITSTPLIEALQIALPIVFEINMKTKIDPSNLVQVAECLQYSAKRNLPEHCVEFLMGIILSNSDDIDPKLAMSVLWSICDLPPDIFFEAAINKMMSILIIHVDSFSWIEMETTVTKMVTQYTSRFPFYYHEVFCDMCVNHVIDNDLGFDQAAYLLRRFHKVNHQSDKLLDYICTKVHNDPSVMKNCDVMVLTSVVYGLAMTNYRPVYWEEVKALLEETDKFTLYQRKEILWIKLASSLCVLGIYKPDVITMAMRASYIHRLFRSGYLSDFENLILVYQLITMQKKDLSGLLPQISLIEQAVKKLKPITEYPLEGALRQAFGGEKFVKTKMLSNMYHQIDHVIIMAKDGCPVPFSKDSPLVVEDMETDPGNQIVAILGLAHFHYTGNNKIMKAHTSLSIKLLESKGYIVVPISLKNWLELEDFEKIPYLVESINSKFKDLDRVSNVN